MLCVILCIEIVYCVCWMSYVVLMWSVVSCIVPSSTLQIYLSPLFSSFFTPISAPDLVIFLDVASEIQAKRGEWGLERYEKSEVQDKVRETYHKMRDSSWVTVDAGGTIEEVEKLIRDAAVPVAQKDYTEPIHELWPYGE